MADLKVGRKGLFAMALSPRKNYTPRSMIVLALLFVLLSVLYLFSCNCNAQSAVTVLHIAPHGADTNPGTKTKPFATLEGSRDAIRQLKKKLKKQPKKSLGPVTVMIGGGIYRRTKPFILEPGDSGTQDNPIVYQSVPGEMAIISGGEIISGWKKTGERLWTVKIPKVVRTQWHFRQLFANDERRDRVRYPQKSNTLKPIPIQNSLDRFRFHMNDLQKDLENHKDAEVVILQNWTAARQYIKSISIPDTTLFFTGKTALKITKNTSYFIDNYVDPFSEFSESGTWYLDRDAALLKYYPFSSEVVMRAIDFVAPSKDIDTLVWFHGDVANGNYVQYITFRGLTFSHTSWTLPDTGYAYKQGEIPPPAAIYAEGTRYCRIERCELSHLGGWGIELGKGSKDNAIVQNKIYDVGAGCIKIGVDHWNKKRMPQKYKDEAHEVERNLIEDNWFCDGGQVYLGAPAVLIGHSSGNLISHNEIKGQFTWGISAGWAGSYFVPQGARDNIIEFNLIDSLGTGIMGTFSGIYTRGFSPGTVIRNNLIRDIIKACGPGAGTGIILDDASSGIVIENNIIRRMPGGCYASNYYSYSNIVLNNVFAYGGTFQVSIHENLTGKPWIDTRTKSEQFLRNVIIWDKGVLFRRQEWPILSLAWKVGTTYYENSWHIPGYLWDYNLYYYAKEDNGIFLGYKFPEWRAKTFMDYHSIRKTPQSLGNNPKLNLPQNNDFSPLFNSPAVDSLKINRIEVNTVGPRGKVGPPI